MDDALIADWNSVVPKDGIVFHLGDFRPVMFSEVKRIIEGRMKKITT